MEARDQLPELLHDVLWYEIYIVTCIPIARQRVGKHIPVTQALNIRRISIAMYRTSKHAFLTTEDGVFCRGPCIVVQNNGKKGIRLCQEGFKCGLKLQ
jgi:hypothetical protein